MSRSDDDPITLVACACLIGIPALRDAVAGHTSREYGPSLIAELPTVKNDGIRKMELVEAMNRLLAESKIHIGHRTTCRRKAKKCLLPGAKP
jgi:hypothetical protein